MHTTLTCQLILARQRSGHSRLNAHMHRKLKIVPTPTCPCGEEDQTTEHVLQRCNRHQPERIAQWSSAIPLHQKLYGGMEDLKKTTNYITAAGLVVQAKEKKKSSSNMKPDLFLFILSAVVRLIFLVFMMQHFLVWNRTRLCKLLELFLSRVLDFRRFCHLFISSRLQRFLL